MLSPGNGSYLSSFDVTSRGKAPDGSCFGCHVLVPLMLWQSFMSQRLLERWSMDVLSDVAFGCGLSVRMVMIDVFRFSS